MNQWQHLHYCGLLFYLNKINQEKCLNILCMLHCSVNNKKEKTRTTRAKMDNISGEASLINATNLSRTNLNTTLYKWLYWNIGYFGERKQLWNITTSNEQKKDNNKERTCKPGWLWVNVSHILGPLPPSCEAPSYFIPQLHITQKGNRKVPSEI